MAAAWTFVDEGSTGRAFVEGKKDDIKGLVEGVLDDTLVLCHAQLWVLLLPTPVEAGNEDWEAVCFWNVPIELNAYFL